MDPGLVLGIAVIAITIAFLLWRRTEFTLLLYGVSLGLPDVVLPLGAVNLRIEDALVGCLLIRLLLAGMPGYTAGQRPVLYAQGVFAVFCFFSAAATYGLDNDSYYLYIVVRFIGCVLALAVLPLSIDSRSRLRWTLVGVMVGGLLLVGQMAFRLANTPGYKIANFQELKGAATPATWGPNAIGQAAVLLAFSAVLGATMFVRSTLVTRVWLALAGLFAAVPAMVFTRGSTIALCISGVLFLALTNRWKALIGVSAVVVAAGTYYLAVMPSYVSDGALNVDVHTGQGFSGRYNRWDTAVLAIEERPLTGYGFGHELATLIDHYGLGVAHNSYLSSWIELGLAGPVMLLAVILAYIRSSLQLLRRPRWRDTGAATLAVAVALTVESLSNSSLYWDKWPMIGLALAFSTFGVADREDATERCSLIVALGLNPFSSRFGAENASPMVQQ